MAKLGMFLAAVTFMLVCCPAWAAPRQQPSPAPSGLQTPAQQSAVQQSAALQNLAFPVSLAPNSEQPPITSYTLPPGLYKRAHGLGRIEFWSQLIAFPYGLILFWIVIGAKLAPKYRDVAERISSRLLLQAAVFSPLLILTVVALSSPMDIFDHALARSYGLSVQAWGSWAWDWTKALCVNAVVGTILIWLLYVVIRRSPRRWWLYFWALSLPVGLFLFFLQPVVVDPLFHKFEPLERRDPALVASLQEMSRRAGENIPPAQMFWMGAGEKTTELNAYVTGIGASKRIVVWDTTIATMTTPQIVFVAGHEMGHYVLNHIPKQLALVALFLFLLLYLGYRSVGWALSRRRQKWEIRGVDDWASLPILILPLFVLSFIANPIVSAVSRHYEHQADQFGLEVTHGLTPDSSQEAARSFQIIGEVDLADPDPNGADVFLFYSHPTIGDRVRFALEYDPWSHGGKGEFVP